MIEFLQANAGPITVVGLAGIAAATAIAATRLLEHASIKRWPPVTLYDPAQDPEPAEPAPVASYQTNRTRKGVMAALKYLRDTTVLDAPREMPVQDLARQLTIEVTGHLNLIALVQRILDATEPPAPAEFTGMTTIPVRSLESLAAEVKVKRDLDAAGLSIFGMPIKVDDSLPPDIMHVYNGDHRTAPHRVFRGQCSTCRHWAKIEGDIDQTGSMTIACQNCGHAMQLVEDRTGEKK